MINARELKAEGGQGGADRRIRRRPISLSLALLFAAVGILFLLIPGEILRFFDELSLSIGLASSPTEGVNFFLVLAVGYMALVTILALYMYRIPENRYFPILLAEAKLASSILSFIFFAAFSHSLIYLLNGAIDGVLGVAVYLLYVREGPR